VQLLTPEVVTQYKKYFQSCQQKGTNAQKLAFEPQDSVQVKEIMNGYLCAGSLTQLKDSRSVATVKCPHCGAIYSRDYAGKVCEICQLCELGQDSLGLNIKLEGVSEPTIAAESAFIDQLSQPAVGGSSSVIDATSTDFGATGIM
jgi:hypothetical protein